MTRRPHRLLLACTLALWACGGDPPAAEPPGERASAAPLAARPLELPDDAGLYPHLAGAEDGAVGILWTERLGDARNASHRLRLSSRADGSFGATRTVAEGAGWFVNWADVPRLALGAGGRRAATWLERLGTDPYAYGVRFALSGGEGEGFGEPRWLHSDRSQTEHGFASLAALPDGRFAAVWLDGRNMTGGSGHDGHGAGDMALFSGVIELDGTVTGELELDGRVCECCPTSLVRLADGTLVVAYRDRGADELRDIALVRGRADEPRSWSRPRAVHDDGWRTPGCPVNGPALAARGQEVACAWFTLGPDGEARVLAARSRDGGLSFGPPRRLDAGDPIGRVALAAWGSAGWVLVWLEQTDPEHAEWRALPLDRELEPGPATFLGRVPSGRPSGYPALVAAGPELLVAWTDPQGPRLRALLLGAR